MPHNWWTRKNLVLAAAVVALAFIGFIVIGVSYPEPAASAALGPDWHCSRLALRLRRPPRSSFLPWPAWRSTFLSVIRGLYRSDMAPGSG